MSGNNERLLKQIDDRIEAYETQLDRLRTARTVILEFHSGTEQAVFENLAIDHKGKRVIANMRRAAGGSSWRLIQQFPKWRVNLCVRRLAGRSAIDRGAARRSHQMVVQ